MCGAASSGPIVGVVGPGPLDNSAAFRPSASTRQEEDHASEESELERKPGAISLLPVYEVWGRSSPAAALNGRRQPSCDGTSRMTREYQVRNLRGAQGEIPWAHSADSAAEPRCRHGGTCSESGPADEARRRVLWATTRASCWVPCAAQKVSSIVPGFTVVPN
jgi:hypothetical protein